MPPMALYCFNFCNQWRVIRKGNYYSSRDSFANFYFSFRYVTFPFPIARMWGDRSRPTKCLLFFVIFSVSYFFTIYKNLLFFNFNKQAGNRHNNFLGFFLHFFKRGYGQLHNLFAYRWLEKKTAFLSFTHFVRVRHKNQYIAYRSRKNRSVLSESGIKFFF